MIEFKLNEKMEQMGMSAYRLAQLTEIHETQIGKLKNGKVKGVTFETLDKLCEALDCEPVELIVRIKNSTAKLAAKAKTNESRHSVKKVSRK